MPRRGELAFVPEWADQAQGFFENVLVHTKGQWARQPFILEPWQRDEIIRPLFGNARWDAEIQEWVRQYRIAWIELARKNGKSEKAAGVALKLLVGDGEEGAEVYGCVDPATRVLCDDLTWRPISTLVPGDKVISLDERPAPGRQRKLRTAIVRSSWATRKQAVRILFEDGRSVICSLDHRWLAKTPGTNTRVWRCASSRWMIDSLGRRHQVKGLQPGDAILDLLDVWKVGTSHDHGYLAGLYDGEGSFHSPLQQGAAFRVTFSQKPGLVLDEFRRVMARLGFAIGYSRAKDSSGVFVEIIGGLRQTMRLLGEVRPHRLLGRHHEIWEGRSPGRDPFFRRIAAIEPVGERDLWDIETTSGTYIADGLVSHNCAKDREQATIVYRVAKRMVELSRVLSKRLVVIDSQKRIIDPKTDSFYQVIAADAAGNLGQNPHGIVFDEIISQPNGDLWDALATGMGARKQPLMVALTTAGNDPASFAAEEHLYSMRVAKDPRLDPSRFVFIRNMPTDVDWKAEANWYYPNPGLRGPKRKSGFLNIQVLRDEARAAQHSIRKQNAFRQFRGNQWVRQVVRWIDMDLWDLNAGMVVPEQLRDRTCFGGLDLAATSDFAAWVLFFPPVGLEPVLLNDDGQEAVVEIPDGVQPAKILARFFLPLKAIERRSSMRDQLEEWVRLGFLTITGDDVLDYNGIRDVIDLDASDFPNLESVGYDRWNANEVVSWMGQHGLTAEGVAQTTTELNAPSRELERLLGLVLFNHGGNPILRWMADNVVAYTDRNGNIKPDRQRSTEKIDGIAALVMAIRQYLSGQAEGTDFAVFIGRA